MATRVSGFEVTVEEARREEDEEAREQEGEEEESSGGCKKICRAKTQLGVSLASAFDENN